MKDKELIEELNKECIELKKSKEYILGKNIYKLKGYIEKMEFTKIFNSVKFRFVEKRIPRINNSKYFYNLGKNNNAKGVVYTCITGGYDLPKEPLYDDNNLEYTLFTDKKDTKIISKWQQEDIKSLIFNGDGNLINRYCKMNPFDLFASKYDYAIYIDGNIQIVSCISDLYDVAKESPIGIAMHRHSERDCIYDEAVACNIYKRGNKAKINQQIEKYKSEGFPAHYGLYEANVIVVDLHNIKAKLFFQQWWNEYLQSQSMRDQISLPYLIWKNNYHFDDIGNLGNNVHFNPKFRLFLHN